MARRFPDLEVSALQRSQDADAGLLGVRGCEAGHQTVAFSCDDLNPVQLEQPRRSGTVTCDGDKVVSHAMGTLLPQPGGVEGAGRVSRSAEADRLRTSIEKSTS